MKKYICLECGELTKTNEQYTECPNCEAKQWEEILKPKHYEVGFWYTEYGTAKITADNPEQAEEIAEARLSYYGIKGLKAIRINDREYGTQDAELL